ncbi:hypothetical protein EC991_006014 [Linnemannia zychae]|nr:hypothetical protein EC991_006014 [Linnemannia zychae]
MTLPDEAQPNVQPIRLDSKGITVLVATRQDTPLSVGKEVVLWEDVLALFPDAAYLQHKTKVLPFLKGSNFKTLIPQRVATVPGEVLDLILKPPQSTISTAHKTAQKESTGCATATGTSTQNPKYGLEEVAMQNYNHMEPSPLLSWASNAASSPAFRQVEAATQNLDHIDASSPLVIRTLGSIGRNPAYGLEEAAMDNYSHIDRPNLNAPGPQFIPEDSSIATFASESGDDKTKATVISTNDKQQPNYREKRTVSARAPQEHRDLKDITPNHPSLGVNDQEEQEKDTRTDKEIDLDRRITAFATLLSLAESGDPKSQLEAGVQYEYGEEGVVKQDFDRAMEWYLKAAEQGGIGDAFTNIGYLYSDRYATKDFSKTVEWTLKGAAASGKEGDGRAENNLGAVYLKGGYGVEQDYTKAFEYFLKGAEKGYAGAQETVAYLYEEGQGVEQDFEKAIAWYKKAGRKGNGAALYRLGNMYHNGRGVEKNFYKAKVQYDRAVRSGSVAAQYAVGVYFEFGWGVSRNYVSAMEYFILAAKNGSEEGAKAVMRLKAMGVTTELLPEYLRSIGK